MRTREEIEKEFNHGRNEFSHIIVSNQELLLSVLLDIRELLERNK